MPTDISRLQTLAAESVGELTHRLLSGNITPTAWMREMERTIARAHTAATIAGVSERDGFTGRFRAWAAGKVGASALPKADRQRLEQTIKAQQPYLAKFASDVRSGTLSDAQIQARSDLYAGPVRATYSKTRWSDVKLPAHPADGSTPCLAWCKCNWLEHEDGMYWTLGTAEHCDECESRASQWSPYRD